MHNPIGFSISSFQQGFGSRHGLYVSKPDFFGRKQKICTVINIGIQMSKVHTSEADPSKQGMIAGGGLCPIPSKTLLGLAPQHPYAPYCT
jgi:hypothetical protein